MPQTNAEKAEAIARRKQRDRDLAQRKRHAVGTWGETGKLDYPGKETDTWEDALERLPMELRVLVGAKDKRVLRGT